MLKIGLWMFAGLALASANTRHIAFTGGVQTGTVSVKGTRDVPGANLPDTVVFDEGLRLAVFNEGSYAGNCGFPQNPGYWLFAHGVSHVGFRKSLDTVWTNETTFPAGALRLDSLRRYVYPTGDTLPPNLKAAAGGARVGVRQVSGLCFSNDFVAGPGFRRVMYFRWTNSGQTRFGKLMPQSFGIYTAPPPFVEPVKELDSMQVAYMLFDSASLDPTPMALRMPPRKFPDWGKGNFYDLRGRRADPSVERAKAFRVLVTPSKP